MLKINCDAIVCQSDVKSNAYSLSYLLPAHSLLIPRAHKRQRIMGLRLNQGHMQAPKSDKEWWHIPRLNSEFLIIGPCPKKHNSQSKELAENCWKVLHMLFLVSNWLYNSAWLRLQYCNMWQKSYNIWQWHKVANEINLGNKLCQ